MVIHNSKRVARRAAWRAARSSRFSNERWNEPPSGSHVRSPSRLQLAKKERLVHHCNYLHGSWSWTLDRHEMSYISFIARVAVIILAGNLGDGCAIIDWQLQNSIDHFGATSFTGPHLCTFAQPLNELAGKISQWSANVPTRGRKSSVISQR